MDYRFVFHFTDSDFEGKGYEVPDTTYWIPLNTHPGKDYNGKDQDDYLDFVGEMEDFGVHDFCTTGDPNGTWSEVIGFSSYEIKASNWPTVMTEWHIWLASEGWEPGEIQSATPSEYNKRFYPWMMDEKN